MRWDCVVLTGLKLVTVSLADPLKCWGLIWPLYACLLYLCILCKQESHGEIPFPFLDSRVSRRKGPAPGWELGGYLGFRAALKTTNDIAKPVPQPALYPVGKAGLHYRTASWPQGTIVQCKEGWEEPGIISFAKTIFSIVFDNYLRPEPRVFQVLSTCSTTQLHPVHLPRDRLSLYFQADCKLLGSCLAS